MALVYARARGSLFALAHLMLVLFAGHALAQQSGNDDHAAQLRSLPWVLEPAQGNIAGKATVNLKGFRFLGTQGTGKFMELTGNLPRDDSYLLGPVDLHWFAVFDFLPEGYVKDDEKIDADDLLGILKEGNRKGTEERKRRGLPTLVLDGWQLPPQYDRENKRLEWATLLHTEGGDKVVNYSTKLLGRRGYTTAVLVSEPATFTQDLAEFKSALKAVDYVPGEKYSEWKEGDKVAAYGLGALIVGGAAAVATKKGFWAALGGVLAAGWKLIAGLAVAALAGVRSLFRRKDQ